MQEKLKLETAVSKNNNRKLVITFDLQQALPLPKLTTGPAFYCRKIWMYNLGIHDCTAGKGHMFLWTENIAKRGSDEAASILLKYLSKITEVDDLIIFTDNCPGQNKNWLLMALRLQLVKEKKFKSITHNFLISGHTHLPSDRDFALIEKRHRKYAPQIYSPGEWHDIVSKANRKTPFEVTDMRQTDFLNFAPILANIKRTTHTNDGKRLDFANAVSYHFNAENTKVFYIKHDVDEDEYKQVNIAKKGRPLQTSLAELGQKYIASLKISKKKIDNNKTLLPYIPPIHYQFYNNLQAMIGETEEEDPEIILDQSDFYC